MTSASSNKKQQKVSLPRQIQFSGLIAFLLFLGVIFLGVAFLRQIQVQNQNFEVGTIFSDRSVSQLQREILRMRNLVSNPELADEESFLLQINLLQSRMNILEDSMSKIRPTKDILGQFNEVMSAWALLAPILTEWQAGNNDPALQAEVFTQLDSIELKVNDMARQYEILRLARGHTFTQTGERLGALLGVVLILFFLFMVTIIYNTYRFVQEHTHAEEQLATYATELERSNKELQQFASVASHDLQEPLRKIRTFGERLQMRNEEILDGRSLDYIARMNNAAERMQRLIEDLLAFSRVTTQSVPFKKVDLNQVVQEVTFDLEARIEEADGRINVESLPIIEADPLQMQQLLQNLLSNGLKFHQEGVAPVITVTSESFSSNGHKQVCLSIKDNGIGIDEEHQDTIFEMFQRLHGRSDYEGTGIGLAICRRIVDRHQGTITVQSQLGQGTTFIIILPVIQT